MAVAPPSASPIKKLAAAQASLQLQQGSSFLMVHQGLPVYTANNANPVAGGVAQCWALKCSAAQKKAFSELKTFHSIVQLHKKCNTWRRCEGCTLFCRDAASSFWLEKGCSSALPSSMASCKRSACRLHNAKCLRKSSG